MGRKKKEEVVDAVVVEDVIDVEPTEEPVKQGNVTRMNMHRLLRRLKTYEARIDNLLNSGTFVTTLINKDVNYKNPDTTVQKISSDFQKLNALINNKAILEQAKIMSNSKTICEIGGRTYTVAEAIKRKENIALEKRVLTALKNQARAAELRFNTEIDKANIELDRNIKSIFGETPANPAEVEEYVKRYEKEKGPIYVDPLAVKDLINMLEKSITDFEIEVDAVLNESNAITIVEVVLDGNE